MGLPLAPLARWKSLYAADVKPTWTTIAMQRPVEQAMQCCVPFKRRVVWRSLLSLQAQINTWDAMHIPAKEALHI